MRHFEWRQHEEGVFQLRIVKFVEMNGEEHELDENKKTWRAIRYDFIEVATDVCSEVGLVELSDGGGHREGFAESTENLPQDTHLRPNWSLLLLYGVLATFVHILLDYVTAYGVRPFEPFSFQWYSYDIVSIIEPLWLAIAIPILARRAWHLRQVSLLPSTILGIRGALAHSCCDACPRSAVPALQRFDNHTRPGPGWLRNLTSVTTS